MPSPRNPRESLHLVPEAFGPLQGVRVLSTGALIAQPFAAALAAEMGAEVIQIERPGVGDVVWRNVGMKLPTRWRTLWGVYQSVQKAMPLFKGQPEPAAAGRKAP